MLNVAMISKWHVHAGGYAKELLAMDDVKITCVWDEIPERGAKWAAELDVDFVACYDELLARSDVDAVIIDTPTNMHKEIMIKAANAKKHIFTEKVMALNVADCDEIITAIVANNVKFCISFPHRTFARNKFIKEAISSGMLGEVTVLRVRNAHNGSLAEWLPQYWYDPETTGGGAMMDLGAHPMYLSRWMLGKPVRIQSMFNNITPRPVEDNSISLIEFENKAIAISETSLVSPMTPMMFEVYGTKGVIICRDNDIQIQTEATSKLVKGGWVTPNLPQDDPKPLRGFVDAVLYGKDIPFTFEDARNLTELMENAYIAYKEGKEVFFK